MTLINSGPRSHSRIDRSSRTAASSLYQEQRAIDSRTVDIDALAALPEGTLGHAYATFLRAHGLTPEIFDGKPDGIEDPRLSYVIQRMRQTHDLWHVVTGCETIQPARSRCKRSRSPRSAPGSANPRRRRRGARRPREAGHRARCRQAVPARHQGEPAAELRVGDHWATPLADVRALLGLPVAPPARAAAA